MASIGSHFWVSQMNSAVEIEPPERATLESEGNNASHKADETAYLYFFKMLVNRQYSVGAKTAAFLADFQANWGEEGVPASQVDTCIQTLPDSPCSAPPTLAMRSVTDQISLLTLAIESNFASMRHPSNMLVEALLPRVFPSVERFLFDRVGTRLWGLYRSYYAPSDLEISKNVESVQKFWAISGPKALAEICGVRMEFSSLQFTRTIELFEELAENLEISNQISPEELLRKQLSILTSLKLSVLEETQGKTEVLAMDDLAPLYLWLFISCKKFPGISVSLLRYCLDSLNEEQRVQTEGRVLALLEGAVRILADETESLMQS